MQNPPSKQEEKKATPHILLDKYIQTVCRYVILEYCSDEHEQTELDQATFEVLAKLWKDNVSVPHAAQIVAPYIKVKNNFE